MNYFYQHPGWLDEWFYLFPEVGTLSKVERRQPRAWEEFARKDLWELMLMSTHSSLTSWPATSPTPSATTSASGTTTGRGVASSATVWTGTAASWGPASVGRTAFSLSSSQTALSSSSSTGWSRAQHCVCSTGEIKTASKHSDFYFSGLAMTILSSGRQRSEAFLGPVVMEL